MKKLLFIGAMLLSAAMVWGQGAGPQVVILKVNGGIAANYKINNQDWWDNALCSDLNSDVCASLSGQDFGTPASLVLDGAITVHWGGENSGWNVLYYRVYKAGQSAPEFTTMAIDHLANSSGSDCRYDRTDVNIDLLALADNGDGAYIFEAAVSFNGSGVTSGYTANFTVGAPPVYYPVTLRVIDCSAGTLTDAPGTWAQDGNIIMRASDNLRAVNAGFTGDPVYGMFPSVNWYENGNIDFPNGQLIKEADRWVWQATFNVMADASYWWEPLNILSGWKNISTPAQLNFSTDSEGKISGDTTVYLGECPVSAVPHVKQKIYIDFGLPTYKITNPDVNGNYWNDKSFSNSTAFPAMIAPLSLINSENEATPYTLQITQKFNSNGGTGNGGLDNPKSELLGDFAVANATLDYLFVEGSPYPGGRTSAFTVRHLDPEKAYKFHIFGTRSSTETRIDSFLIVGLNVSGGSLQTSGTGTGSESGNGNDSKIFVSELVYPAADSTIKISVGRKASQYAAVSAMKIEEWEDIEPSNYQYSRKFYFDFGHPDTALTVSPDINGNHWNNITSAGAGAQFELVDNSGAESEYGLQIVTAFELNNTSPGNLYTPDPEQLYDFAVATATKDYFFGNKAAGAGAKLKITGLKPLSGYRFSVFGSRTDGTSVRLANMIFKGMETFSGVYQTSGTGTGADVAGGAAVNQNTSSLYETPVLTSDASGEISLEISVNSGSYYHLNAMRMEEYIYNGAVAPTSVKLSCTPNPIINTGVTPQIEAKVLPEEANVKTVQYSVISGDSAAWVSAEGVLHPKGNGTVTVVGRIAYDNIDISDTLQIVIINQIKELYIAGSACENGDGIENAVKMHPVTDTLGTVTNYFEVYMRLNSGSLKFHTNKDGTGDVYGDGCTANSIVADGGDIVSVYDTTVRVSVDLSTLTYTITPVQWGITGNGIMLSGWQSSGYPELDYKGNGVWAKEMVFLAANPATSGNGRARINFIANNSWDWVFDKVRGSNNVVFRATNTITGREVEDVNTNLDGGKLYIALDLQNYTYSISCVETYPNKITVIGSSTPRGTGATNDYGYVGMYGSLLDSRYTGGQSANEWKLSNVCINGNYTGSVWTRWQEDLINNCADYVMIGLTFGNERDNVSPDSAAFENYRKNLFKMIDSVRAMDKIPVVGTPYVRADFNAQQYEYIKELNRIISGWDVPSVNLLGAADDLTGKWPDGYWCGDILVDRWHPNDAGHKEFYHAMVPSLFDALKEAKPVPVRTAGNGYTLGNNINGSITLTPEDTAHSFTLSFAVKSEGTGVLVYMNGTEGISINVDGKPVYGSITGAAAINDNNYHRITLTHYYAAGKTLMFIDSTLAGTADERRVVTHYAFGGTAETPNTVTYKELFFYRSAMFDREIADLVRGEMLRSSLEIYSPLDNNLDNSAQSLNVLHLYRKTTSDMFNYDLPRIETYDGTVKRAAVTPKHTGMNTVTVRYNGDTNAPVNAGKYGVTVDMDGNDDFSGAEGLLLDTLTIAKATVTSSHLWSSLQVEDTVAFDGEKHTVLVEAENDVVGLGEITVFYNGDTVRPVNAGTYAIVADIAEGQNYLAAQILLGDFVIKEDYIADTAELSKSDFIYTLPQTVVYDGTKKSVSVTARMEGTGAVTVKYNGDTTRPVNAGKYEVTVDVQASAVFKEATGLLLDTLTIEKANMLKSYLQWESCGTVLYDGAEHSVAVTFADNLTVDGFGEITVLYNNDIVIPVQTGTYIISANIGEGQNFNSASFVLDTLIIAVNPAIQGPWAVTLKVIDKSKGSVTNKVNDQNEINIICAVSDNLKGQNIRNPNPGEWWYPMYGGSGIVPDGELIKTDSSWEWTLTLMADTGTYYWKPYAKTLGWKVINQGMYDYTGDDGDNLIFFMNMGGAVTGNYELVIPDPNVVPNLHIITKNDLNYTLPRTETYDGLPVSVPVTAKYPNMGAVTVKYNGSTTVPVNAGLYEITVDIAANDTFEQATGLLLDTLTIAKAAVLSEYLEYRIDSAAYDGLPHSVEVSAEADIEGLGDITVLYNNDTAVPVAVGVYEIKADVAEGLNYLPAILTLGNFKIYEELSVGISSALKKSHLNAYISNNLLYVSPEATSVRLMSINGATIFETKGMGRTYNVGMLSDGIYLVLMQNGWEVRTVKVVK